MQIARIEVSKKTPIETTPIKELRYLFFDEKGDQAIGGEQKEETIQERYDLESSLAQIYTEALQFISQKEIEILADK